MKFSDITSEEYGRVIVDEYKDKLYKKSPGEIAKYFIGAHHTRERALSAISHWSGKHANVLNANRGG